jgi:hypothetical protein
MKSILLKCDLNAYTYRLILQVGTYNTDGSIYSTESETFCKITAHNQIGSGVEYFIVETKEEKILEFGKTTDSRVYSHNSQDIIVWKINKISDLNGNYITFNYVEIGDEHLISSIQYTGNTVESISPYISIDFEYLERNDPNTIYTTEYGKEITSKHLLDNINIIYLPTSTSFKKYEFKYGENFYSYLNEVIEYGKDDSQNHYNTLRFTYHDAGHEYSEITTSILPDEYEMYPGDFNGDGLTDILRAKRHINGNNQLEYISYQTILNSPNGYLSPQSISLPVGVITSQSMNSPIIRETGIVFFDVSDYNGDGKDDIAIAVAIKGPIPLKSNQLRLSQILIYYSNSATSIQFNSPTSYTVSPLSSNYIGRQNAIIKGDFNGDGAMDLFCNVQDGFKPDHTHHDNAYNPQIFYPRISATPHIVNKQGDNFSYNKLSYLDKAYVLDMNGNGRNEIMQVYEHSNVNRTAVREFQFGNNLAPLVIYDDNHFISSNTAKAHNEIAKWFTENL